MASDDELELEAVLEVTIKRKSKKKSDFEVELRDDGYYYISNVPAGYKSIGIGDRVMEVNGTKFSDFKDEKHVNGLFDTFRLEVIPIDNDDDESDEDEDYEEVERPSRRAGGAEKQTSSKKSGGGGAGDDNDVAGNQARSIGGGRGDRKAPKVEPEEASDGDDEVEDVEGYEEVNENGRGGRGKKEESSSAGRTGQKPQVYDEDEESDDVVDGGEDESEEDDDEFEEYEEVDRKGSRNDRKSRRSSVEVNHPTDEQWQRPYVSKYETDDKFMITVTKEDGDYTGIDLVQYKGEIFVFGIERGPFFSTAIDLGDKVLSINGKKPPDAIGSVEEATAIMAKKPKITLYVLRPDPIKDKGYQWVMKNSKRVRR